MNVLGLLTEWMVVRTAWIVAAVAMGVDIVSLIVFSKKYKEDRNVGVETSGYR